MAFSSLLIDRTMFALANSKFVDANTTAWPGLGPPPFPCGFPCCAHCRLNPFGRPLNDNPPFSACGEGRSRVRNPAVGAHLVVDRSAGTYGVFLYFPFQHRVIGTLTYNRHLAMRDGAARGILRMKWSCRIGLAPNTR